jgi:toxin secretion/phage lysis holin
MKYQTDSFWTSIVGGGWASLVYLLGGIDQPVIALAIFQASDYFTGLAAGFALSKINSKRAFVGLIKKAVMLILVIVAHQLDVVAGSSETHFMRNAMILFLIGVEGISLTENAAKIGITVPKFLRTRFEQMKNENDKESA